MQYRIGLKPECPVHIITLGGFSFSKVTERVSGYGGDTKRTEIIGAIVTLTKAQIEGIFAGAKNRVVRSTRGKKSRSRVYAKDSRGFRPSEFDREVIELIYIKPLGEFNPHEEFDAPSLADTFDQLVGQYPKSRAELKAEALERDKKLIADKASKQARESKAIEQARQDLQAGFDDLDKQRAEIAEMKKQLAEALEQAKAGAPKKRGRPKKETTAAN